MQQSTIPTTRRRLRWLLVSLAVVMLAVLLGGCLGGGPKFVPFSTTEVNAEGETRFEALGQAMARIEQARTPAALTAVLNDIQQPQTFNDPQKENGRPADREKLENARIAFLQGYLVETLSTNEEIASQVLVVDSDDGRLSVVPYQADVPVRAASYARAQANYERALASGTPYSSQAIYRLGLLAKAGLIRTEQQTSAALAKRYFQQAEYAYSIRVWQRQPALAGEGGAARLIGSVTETPRAEPTLFYFPVDRTTRGQAARHDLATLAIEELDEIYRQPAPEGARGLNWDYYYWQGVNFIVTTLDRVAPGVGAVLALILIALLVKVVTIPMTTASFRGMRDMQRVQPLLKELQEKYKDDKAKLAEEQMKLMKEHKVSPLGGCLPMLIQLPIFIVVYQAVRVYSAGFTSAQFFWIDSLARPDLLLLILYGISMIVTQKMTAMPSTDPQQKMMQTQMTFLMPIILVIAFQGFPSAFILYWFFLNIFSAAHQYYLMRKFQEEDDAKAAQTASATAPAVTTVRPSGKGQKKGK
jgi:YidC/Oxa1 family membrane protein insertase